MEKPIVIIRLVMTLDAYLRLHGYTEFAFAAEIGASQASVSMYRRGKRVPRPPIMRRITTATKGAVQASDFYDAFEAASSAA